MSEVVLTLPTEFASQSGFLDVRHEEDVVIWFWAHPELMPWPRPVLWLYTPVTGNSRWPGDLWGVDSAGNLLVFECKQCKRSDDPFKDFLSSHRQSRIELTAAHWKKKFRRHLEAELKLPSCLEQRSLGNTAGILPRSNKRSHLRRWPELARVIDARIRSLEFQANVAEYLETRERAGNPTPYYFGLMVSAKPEKRILTEFAIESAKALQAIAGADRVGVVVVTARITPPKTLLVNATTGDIHAASAPMKNS